MSLARSPLRTSRAPCAALLCAICLLAAAVPVSAREGPQPIREVPAADLPPEARATLALIKRGGPFPYRQDGAVFGNFEHRLPVRGQGYYREYTVPTPGAHDRGPRRIVAGAGESGDAHTSGEYYYTGDHYRTFRRVRE